MRDIDEMEREVISLIWERRRAYLAEVEPLFKQLADIQALKPPRSPMKVSLEEFQQMTFQQIKRMYEA